MRSFGRSKGTIAKAINRCWDGFESTPLQAWEFYGSTGTPVFLVPRLEPHLMTAVGRVYTVRDRREWQRAGQKLTRF
jgi:hypothetical protein